MIHLTKGRCPAVLLLNAKAWTNRLTAAASNEARKYALRKNRHPHILAALTAETHGKCAYCESKITAVAVPEVEHIMPKSLNDAIAFRWDNLTLACPLCNNRKSAYANPHLPLLDPYVDHPDQFIFAFGAWFKAWRNDPRGHVSITQLDLNRPGLIEARERRITEVEPLVHAFLRSANSATKAALWAQVELELSDGGEYALALRTFVRSQCGS